jgi:hypothetical protein
LSLYENGVKLTRLIADSAVDAFFLVNGMGFFLLTGNGFLGTLSETDVAAVTFLFVYLVVEETFTDSCAALLVVNVIQVFVLEIQQGC